MHYLTSWYWDKGNFRKKNEDSFSLQRVCLKGIFGKTAEAALAMVCDGIGGLPEGETASGFVTQQMTEWFYRDGMRRMKGRRWKKRVAEGATDALCRIQEQIERCERAEGICCGTTCTMAFVKKRQFVLLHVGDSRAYLIGRREKRLTRDHLEDGVLRRCVGAFSFQYPDVLEGRIGKREMLLLCTDGFWARLPEGFLKRSLISKRAAKREELHERLQEISGFGRAEGERDNQTAVLLACSERRVGA